METFLRRFIVLVIVIALLIGNVLFVSFLRDAAGSLAAEASSKEVSSPTQTLLLSRGPKTALKYSLSWGCNTNASTPALHRVCQLGLC